MRRREVPYGWSCGVAIMADRALVRCFWRILDKLDYWLTQARLLLADVVYDPEPETAGHPCRDQAAGTPTDSDGVPHH
jgi:hypothetical protein